MPKLIELEITEEQENRLIEAAGIIVRTVIEIVRSNLSGANVPLMIHKGLIAEMMLSIVGELATRTVEAINSALELAFKDVEEWKKKT